MTGKQDMIRDDSATRYKENCVIGLDTAQVMIRPDKI